MPSASDAPSSSSFFDCGPFRKLMWDDAATTTANDKERWVRERIATPHLQGTEGESTNNAAATAAVASAAAAATPAATSHDMDTNDAPPTPLDTFAGSTHHHSNHPPPVRLWGLTQKHGGPCGVLAALQAEMIRILLFGRGGGRRELFYPFLPEAEENYRMCGAAPITAGEADEAMAMAAGMILARAARTPAAAAGDGRAGGSGCESAVRLVLPEEGAGVARASGGEGESADDTAPWIAEMLGASSGNAPSGFGLKVHIIDAPSEADMDVDDDSSPAMKRPRNYSISSITAALSLEQRKIAALAGAVASFLLGEKENAQSRPLEHLRRPGGVILLVMSLVHSRGIDRLRRDMDDPASTITSQFGHTSQELMNLLLTGQAVSNVFDNSMTLSEELTCHGIQRRPAVGYLSVLESLRYCEVGNYYKCPLFPIWVVGSTSHFSVLFGDERCLRESKSDILLERCRRAFKKVEGGDENGFIPVDKLGDVLDELDMRTKVGGDSGVQTLQAYLEVSGAGIIIWNDFWKAASRLVSGSSLESIMSSNDDAMQIDSNNAGPPLLITQFGEDNKPAATATAAQSDEELAKKLAEEWGSMPELEAASQGNAKSDEDYARELQAQWNAEEAGNAIGMDVIDLRSEAATTDDDIPTLASRPPTPIPEAKPAAEQDSDAKMSAEQDSDAKMSAEAAMGETAGRSNQQQLDFEKHGDSFPLYHYNGLHGGTLTPFRLTRLSPTEAVGASIALSKGGSGHGGGGGDLEDVVRTKWPSSVINWLGKNPPSID